MLADSLLGPPPQGFAMKILTWFVLFAVLAPAAYSQSVLYTFDGNSPIGFGFSVSGAGDVNGDGFDDLILGAQYDDNNGKNSGSARVFSGLDGSLLYHFDGDSAGDRFGISVSGAGDVNGGGHADLIIGAYWADNSGVSTGTARVFSGLDGTSLYLFEGDSWGDGFGYSVGGAGDVNGDGYDDVIVGIPEDDNNGAESGSARVFSGVDGNVIYTFDGDAANSLFGHSVSGGGDMNGDGYADLVVGAKWADTNGVNSGSVRVFSGVDGTSLFLLDGYSGGDEFGYSVSVAGDVNGDGYADVIVGAPRDDSTGTNWGSVRVFSGCDFCGPIGQNYCGPANFNSTGQSAVISALGSVNASDNSVTLIASLLPLNVFGYYLNSDVQGFTPFPPGSQGNLCLAGGIGRHAKQIGNSGPAGELVIDVDLTALPRPNGTHSVAAGETWNFQCWFRDNQGGPTSNFTDGIEIVFN